MSGSFGLRGKAGEALALENGVLRATVSHRSRRWMGGLENPRLGLSFPLDFDPSLFRWLVSWQAYSGARATPLAGSYALGIEPWTTSLPLEQAVAAGEAIVLHPGRRLSATVRATFARMPAQAA